MNTTFFENEKIKIYAGKLVDQFDGIYFFYLCSDLCACLL